MEKKIRGVITKTNSVFSDPESATPVCSGSAERTAVWNAGIAAVSEPTLTDPFQAEQSGVFE